MRQLPHYLGLAEVFRYPDEGFIQRVRACHADLAGSHPGAAEELAVFSAHVAGLTREQQEELYIKTFDVQALCYPDIGFVLFGEDYKRGMFLVHMKQEHQRAGSDFGTELPDHITNVLALISRTPDESFRNELVVGVTVPALKKMLEGFDDVKIKERMALLKKKHDAIVQESLNYGNVYQHALKALLLILEQDFAGVEVDIPLPQSNAIPMMPETAAGTSFFGKSCSGMTASRGG